MTNTNEVRIEVSTMCNYKCIFCPHSSAFNREKGVMPFSVFKAILDKFKTTAPQITELTISGMGEPLLDVDLYNKLEYGSSLGYNVRIVTNGLLLNEKLIKNICSLNNMESIRISFHSAFRERYKHITKVDAYDKVFDNIKLLNKLKQDTKILVTADIVDNHKNELNELKHMFKDVDLLEVWRPHNWIDWASYRNNETRDAFCGRPIDGPIHVLLNGDINICNFDFNGIMKIGNIIDQSLDDIFTSNEYMHIYNCHINKNIDTLPCKTCDQLQNNKNIMLYDSAFIGENRLNMLSSTYREYK